MRMVGAPIGRDGYQTTFATEEAMGEALELLRTLVKMELVVRASFQIMRLLASSRMTFCSVLFAKFLVPALRKISKYLNALLP